MGGVTHFSWMLLYLPDKVFNADSTENSYNWVGIFKNSTQKHIHKLLSIFILIFLKSIDIGCVCVSVLLQIRAALLKWISQMSCLILLWLTLISSLGVRMLDFFFFFTLMKHVWKVSSRNIFSALSRTDRWSVHWPRVQPIQNTSHVDVRILA